MKLPYKSRNPKAGIVSYEIVGDAIILEFKHGRFRYVYNSVAPGPVHVAAMVKLAAEGKGLTTYVSQHVQEHYAARLPLDPPARS